jgi:SnoaL-like domain
MPPEFDELLEALRAAQRAFNAGDFETAFAGVAPDVEWHSGSWVIDGGVFRGKDALIRFFTRGQDAGDWRVEAQETIDAGEGRYVVRRRGESAGRVSKITDTMEFFQVYELAPDGLVARVREFESREDAFRAAGLEE